VLTKSLFLQLEINFYFACIGLFLLAVYNLALTDNYTNLVDLMLDPELG